MRSVGRMPPCGNINSIRLEALSNLHCGLLVTSTSNKTINDVNMAERLPGRATLGQA